MIVTLLVFLLILSVLVLIHEFGHYFVAKKLGIKVEEFGYGFPPRVWGKKIGETLYSINLLPIGGFVKLFGEDEAGGGRLDVKDPGEKISAKDKKRAFFSRPVHQRAAVVLSTSVPSCTWQADVFVNGIPFSFHPLIDTYSGDLRYIDGWYHFYPTYNQSASTFCQPIIPTPTSTPTMTPTSAPTPLPPTLTLSADPDIVSYNGSSTLMWTSTNTTSCTGTNGWTGTKSLSGNQSTGPLTSAKTYTLTCIGPGGSITQTTTVNVMSPPTLTPTPTPTRTPTPTSTPVPTNTPMPTATPVPQATQFNVTAFMHGIGNSGDNANPNSFTLSNKNPVRQQRKAILEIFDANNNLILTKEGILNYSAIAGNFTGIIDAGTTLTAGVYTVKVKTPQYLKKLFPGFVTVTPGQTLSLATVTFVTGDVVTDNALNILDYNVIVGCYSDFAPAISCTAQQKLDADLTDDGKVNQFDYNLFLRDLTVQNGE